MSYYKVPMLIDVFRLTTSRLDETTANLIEYLKRAPGGFNYNRAALFQRKAYQGYRDDEQLYLQCLGDGTKQERIQNARVVKLITPFAVNRSIQVFSLPKRNFSLTKGVDSPMGPSFFLVEAEVVKVFYLHCRNAHRATKEDIEFWAAAQKFEVLDTEFYGLKSDFEILNVGPRDRTGNARVERLSLADLSLPTLEQVKERTDTFISRP